MPRPARDAVSLAVVESSQVGEARRLASSLAERIGFDPTQQARVALIVTELGNNLVRHASQGELILQRVRSDGRVGIEALAIDRGPGVINFQRCLADGFSTAGTPGTGLGTVARQADLFDVYSLVPKGTVISARVWLAARGGPAGTAPRPTLDLGSVCLPMAGEDRCGDAWAFEATEPGRSALIVADGLGHGPKAAEASDLAIATFRQNPTFGPAEQLAAIYPTLRPTRGAAVAVTTIDHDRRELRFAGVGNIAGTIFENDARRQGLISHNGTVGAAMPRVQEFAHPWPDEALLVLHSDGLATSWRLDNQPLLRSREPGVIAGALYRDFNRGRDDVTVVVARNGGIKSP